MDSVRVVYAGFLSLFNRQLFPEKNRVFFRRNTDPRSIATDAFCTVDSEVTAANMLSCQSRRAIAGRQLDTMPESNESLDCGMDHLAGRFSPWNPLKPPLL